ncbi:GNAT family N-acetyltransferase [Tranquillimonas alkanivorans]|uniref:L-ornithine N(alpha)-acyltransferase n=1 Tax=Tranquillimonas alkanivorans TaxID=441119 RepID=A0A1I5RV60_9RHOB|nr:GNAT family N-acyltransferase [Tranquillimonas alkanivorans]SFP62310.1 ornithine-acyl[acyl carrier protein] N-acyltransferase [Tranquillimonas alkanivorans]
MMPDAPKFALRLAQTESDLVAAQRLRYEVFVDELGGDGPLVNHDARREMDRFDPYFDHMVLIDPRRPEGWHVIGVYRLLREDQARRAGQFYSEDEYDLTPLRRTGRRLLELGRSCLHRDYRGGTAMVHLWNGLSDYVQSHGIEVLFGVASFHGTDPRALAEPLSYLHHRHLAPPELRVRSVMYQPMDLIPGERIDRVAAMRATPALIKAYLRMGGFVGNGAFIDHAFNTTDVCLVMDVARANHRQRALYARGRL